MITVQEMTGPEMRNTNPTLDQLCEAVEILVVSGWTFKVSSRPVAAWNEGWWINQAHPTKCRPVGDSRNFHLAAWDAVKAYIKE